MQSICSLMPKDFSNETGGDVNRVIFWTLYNVLFQYYKLCVLQRTNTLQITMNA